jgi:hypothetical protein
MKKGLNAALCIGALVLVAGCSSLGTQFSAMDEPSDGARARVRVTANMLVKGVPESSCLNWRKPGAGTIMGGIVGSSGHRGRSIGIPNPDNLPQEDSAEFYVRAGEPIAIQLINTPDSYMRCGIDITFVPKEGADYQVVMVTRKIKTELRRSRCSASVQEITEEGLIPVPTQRADRRCR